MSEQPIHTVLAIESSCDETAAAVTRGSRVLSSVVASQVDLHALYGGVVPEVASRRHMECVEAVIDQALTESGLTPGLPGQAPVGLDAIAVTCGPGLIGALLVGIAAASSRAWAWGLPLIPVDHLVGHVASVTIDRDDIRPPMLCLLVSGGHTLLLSIDEQWQMNLLGSTRDDAAGEAFDKGARLLGLGLPGGPALESLAAHGNESVVSFTPAMVHHDTLDTSFSGLKTALAVAVRDQPDMAAADLAAGFQRAVVTTLVASVGKAIKRHGPGTEFNALTLAVVGGVAANSLLRSELESACAAAGMRLQCAPLRYCGDNAAMIGAAICLGSGMKPSKSLQIDAYASSPVFRYGKLLPTGALE